MFGIAEGPSQHEIGDRNTLAASSTFATGAGEGDITASNKFMQDILSGDPTKAASALAPEIGETQKQTQQAKNSLAQFGPRSGGTAASTANMDTAGRSNLIQLLGNLRGKSASDLGTMGSNLLGMGMEGTSTLFGQDKTMHDQSMQQLNDLAKSIADAVAGAATGGAGAAAAGKSVAGGMIGGALGTL